ncbi:MAG: hypothetical protein ACR5LF_09795 [Symbiopectobacterium sp.]
MLIACTPKPKDSLSDWQNVNAPAVLELAAEARQEPAGLLCSPSCSSALTKERDSWQQPLADLEFGG